MNRIKLSLALMLCVLTTLAAPAIAAPAAVDQSAWTGLKKQVRLPSGLNMAYVELGDPSGEPLLLLHGYTDSSRSFSLVAPYLADRRLIIPDQRGHGASDAPTCCYGLSTFADEALQLLNQLGIARADVVGHSLGSMVAITLAAEHPQRVRSIALIGSTALIPVTRDHWLYQSATGITAPIDPSSDFMREWHPANQPTPVDPKFAAAVFDELLVIPPHVWRGVLRELVDQPVGRHAADVKAPVLLLSGGKDPLFPAEHHAALLKAFPHAQAQVFAELGHNPNWEQPDAIAAAIRRFLDTRP